MLAPKKQFHVKAAASPIQSQNFVWHTCIQLVINVNIQSASYMAATQYIEAVYVDMVKTTC